MHMSKNIGGPNSIWPNMRENVFFATVTIVVLILLGTLLATLTLKTLVEVRGIGEPEKQERTITVEGTATSSTEPDIATITVSIDTTEATVEEAQSRNNTVTTSVTSALKALGISGDDIQTSSYNLYEDEFYNSETGEFEPRGWIVYQSLEVRVRDINIVGDVLDAAGRSGATDIYGPDFRVDDPSSQIQNARAEAIADARKQAAQIARALGASVGEVIDYDEWTSGGSPYYSDYAYGVGGYEELAVEPGSEDVSLTVTITFEIVE